MAKAQRLKDFIYISVISIYTYLITFVPAEATNSISQGLKDGITDLWEEYWFYIAIFVALGVLTGLLAFIILFIRLGANADNPEERSKIYREMLAVAVCTAALGSITFIVAMYLSLFN